MVEPPGAPLRPTWEPALGSRISLVGGGTLSRTHYTHNPRTESGSFLVLANAQMFVGGVDVDYFVRDGPPKFPQYFGNSSLGKPSNRHQSPRNKLLLEYPVPAAAAAVLCHKNRQVAISREPRVVS